MLFENLMFLNVCAIQYSFLISGSDASDGPANTSLVHELDAPTYPSKTVPRVLLRFRATPIAFRAAGSLMVVLVTGAGAGVQKFAANGSSVVFPPITQWFVMLRRCWPKLWIE